MNELKYDVIIVGAGPGGLYTAYELTRLFGSAKKILVVDAGNELNDRHCPIIMGTCKKCCHCNPCNIMQGFGGAGAFSDFKYNITNHFGGTLAEKIGSEKALELMKYVDKVNTKLLDDRVPKMFSSQNSALKKKCTQNGLRLLDADIRHLGTDNGLILLKRMYHDLKFLGVEFMFNTELNDFGWAYPYFQTVIPGKNTTIKTRNLVFAVGRSGSKWMSNQCKKFHVKTTSNRIDLGIRYEVPYEVFSDITDELYEGKIVYRTDTYEDSVRTFCMNPHGSVVTENTNGIITVNGHSYEDPSKHTDNTNFALLVSQSFTQPFTNGDKFGELIATLSNSLAGGEVLVQRFGDLIRGHRSTEEDLRNNSVIPTLKTAVAGDISSFMPHRFCQDIIETIYALNKIAPGTANPDNLMYATEVKFYDNIVDVNENLEMPLEGYDENAHIYCIGDGSGITHSLSQAAASGVFVATKIKSNLDNTVE